MHAEHLPIAFTWRHPPPSTPILTLLHLPGDRSHEADQAAQPAGIGALLVMLGLVAPLNI